MCRRREDYVTVSNRAAFDGALAILGTVRNGGDGLRRTLHAIDRLIARLTTAHVILATNDNEDETDKTLQDWITARERVELIRLDGLVGSVTLREDRIALGRCFLLERLFRMAQPPALTLVADLDGPNANLPVDTILEICGNRKQPWDAVFANQEEAYYDLWALRHPQWCPGDCWQELEEARSRLFRLKRRSKLMDEIVYARQYRIPVTHPWIEVDSAFGGLGLYRTDALRGHWYSARTTGARTSCEHVALHRSMRAAGARLFIAPELLNEAPTEHLGPSSGKPFPYPPQATEL